MQYAYNILNTFNIHGYTYKIDGENRFVQAYQKPFLYRHSCYLLIWMCKAGENNIGAPKCKIFFTFAIELSFAFPRFALEKKA